MAVALRFAALGGLAAAATALPTAAATSPSTAAAAQVSCLVLCGAVVGGVGACARSVGACALVMGGARVRVTLPRSALPLTGQTAAVCLATLVLGRTAATAGSALYAALALLGFPILAGGQSGLTVAAAGYVLGFPLCAWLAANETATASPLHIFGRSVIAQAACVAVGATWSVARGATPPAAVWARGARPFLPGLLMKAACVAALSLPYRWLTSPARPPATSA